MFKNKIRRVYRIDKVNKKLNTNLLSFLKENKETLNVADDLLDYFKNSVSHFKKNVNFDLKKKFPKFKIIYEEFLKSDKFKKFIMLIKNKHDEEYLKLFFRHTKNFLNLHSRNIIPCKSIRRIRMINSNKSSVTTVGK